MSLFQINYPPVTILAECTQGTTNKNSNRCNLSSLCMYADVAGADSITESWLNSTLLEGPHGKNTQASEELRRIPGWQLAKKQGHESYNHISARQWASKANHSIGKRDNRQMSPELHSAWMLPEEGRTSRSRPRFLMQIWKACLRLRKNGLFLFNANNLHH